MYLQRQISVCVTTTIQWRLSAYEESGEEGKGKISEVDSLVGYGYWHRICSLVGSLNKIPLSIAGILLFKVPTSLENSASIFFGKLTPANHSAISSKFNFIRRVEKTSKTLCNLFVFLGTEAMSYLQVYWLECFLLEQKCERDLNSQLLIRLILHEFHSFANRRFAFKFVQPKGISFSDGSCRVIYRHGSHALCSAFLKSCSSSSSSSSSSCPPSVCCLFTALLYQIIIEISKNHILL